MIFEDFKLLDKDGEVDSVKLEPFIDAQMKNFSESSGKDAAMMTQWTPIIKESFEKCINKSLEINVLEDLDSRKRIKSVDENIEPILVIMCYNLHNIAVSFY